MKCEQARALLRQDVVIEQADAAALRKHLQACNECRTDADTQRLVRALRSLPAPSPEAGFEHRVMAPALARLPRRQARHHVAWFTALAASVCIAIVATLQIAVPERTPRASVSPEFSVRVLPAQTRVVDVLLEAPRALQGATLVVSLDGVQLENRPHTRELRWTTNLEKGANKLSLPVQLLDSAEGEVLVRLEHGETRREVKVRVLNAELRQQGEYRGRSGGIANG